MTRDHVAISAITGDSQASFRPAAETHLAAGHRRLAPMDHPSNFGLVFGRGQLAAPAHLIFTHPGGLAFDRDDLLTVRR